MLSIWTSPKICCLVKLNLFCRTIGFTMSLNGLAFDAGDKDFILLFQKQEKCGFLSTMSARAGLECNDLEAKVFEK